MNLAAFRKEAMGIGLALLFLVVGFLVAYFVRAMHITMGDSVLIFLLLIPLLVYLVWTERLSGLKGPGGLEASFVAMARRPAEEMVSASIEMIPGTAQLINEGASAIRKRSSEELATLEKRLEKLPPVVLELFLGAEHYKKKDLLTYLDRLMFYQTFKFVVFLDNQEHFVAFIPAWAMLRILLGVEGDRFMEIVNQGRISELWNFPGIQRRAISPKSDSLNALREMANRNLDAMLLVDKQDQVKGVVERTQVINQLVLAMAQT